MTVFSRTVINNAARESVLRRKPILLGGAGCGFVAQVLEKSGIDLILAYSSGSFRMDGHPSGCGWQPFGNGNNDTLTLGKRLTRAAPNTPVIAGIGPADPERSIAKLLDAVERNGFSGVTNVPTSGVFSGAFRSTLESSDCGYRAETELVKECNSRNVFTVMYAFTEEEATQMAAAGADMIAAHVRGTAGGSVGIRNVLSLEEACERTQRIYEAAVRENPSVIVLCHGGPFSAPSTVRIAFEKTSVKGYIGASAIERIPSESAITQAVTRFRGFELGGISGGNRI